MLHQKIAFLFNLLLNRRYLPTESMRTYVVTIIKNRTGDIGTGGLTINLSRILVITVFSKIV